LRCKVQVFCRSIEPTPRQANELLADIAAARNGTRRAQGRPWPAPMVFGVVALVVAALAPVVDGTPWLVVAWTLGTSLALVFTSWLWARRGEVSGVIARRRVWATATATCIACLVGAIAVGAFASAPLAYSTPMVLVVLGYAALGVLQRDPWTTLTVLPGVVAGITLAAAHQPGWVVDLAFGVGLLGAGVILFAIERRPAR
jgi:hypothetical protein